MSQTKKRLLHLTHLHLENWRNFTQIDASLQRRVFLFGPNASGKSNFLDVFRFLHDIVAVGGGFQEAVRRRGGVSKLRSLAARRYPEIVIRAQIGHDAVPASWEYELRFTQDNRQRPILRQERVSKDGKVIVQRPDEHDERDAERLTQTYLEQVNANLEFREVAEFFSAIRYLHLVPQLVREPDRSVGRSNDPYGGDFLDQIARATDRTRKSRLKRIRDALAVAVPQLTELEMWRDPASGSPHLRGKYDHWRPQGAWQTEEQFSDGTLRLLGLLWAVLDGNGALLLEEPELSLHPDVVRYIPQMFARIQRRTDRQILVSSHSSDLLRDDGIGLDEVLVLQPGSEGTVVHAASQFEEIVHLLEGGSSLGDTIPALTRPANVQQLAMFEG